MSKHISSGSVAIWLILVAFFISFVLFLPIPYFHQDSGWFMGPSIGARMMAKDGDTFGEAGDSLMTTYIKHSVESPFGLNCETDLDCTTIHVRNQCKSYCAATSPDNKDVISRLENNRVCDPAMWKQEVINCRCILNKCITVEY